MLADDVWTLNGWRLDTEPLNALRGGVEGGEGAEDEASGLIPGLNGRLLEQVALRMTRGVYPDDAAICFGLAHVTIRGVALPSLVCQWLESPTYGPSRKELLPGSNVDLLGPVAAGRVSGSLRVAKVYLKVTPREYWHWLLAEPPSETLPTTEVLAQVAAGDPETGVKFPISQRTLQVYAQHGLIPRPRRTGASPAQYPADTPRRVAAIQWLLRCGSTLPALVAELNRRRTDAGA